jgi:hypothetical protein
MGVADPIHLLYAPPLVVRRRGKFLPYIIYKGTVCMMLANQTIDTLAIKLERVHVLADILVSLLADNTQAQVLAEIIMETSLLPGD